MGHRHFCGGLGSEVTLGGVGVVDDDGHSVRGLVVCLVDFSTASTPPGEGEVCSVEGDGVVGLGRRGRHGVFFRQRINRWVLLLRRTLQASYLVVNPEPGEVSGNVFKVVDLDCRRCL